MSSRANIIATLDIGTSNVSVLVTEVDTNGEVRIIGVGRSPSRGLRKGAVINIEATVESISEAVTQAERMSGLQINTVYASVSGTHIRGLNSTGVVGVRNKEVAAYDIDKVIDAAKAVAIPADREVLHVLPQEFIVDGQDGIKEPIGISGVRLEARVHIITGLVSMAQNIVKCANRCGLTVKDIILAPLASGVSVLSIEEQELGVAVVDIGGGTTDIAVYHAGSLRYTTVLAIGGNHITNDIAAGLRTPIAAAEDVKCNHGSAVPFYTADEETLEVPSTGGRPSRIVSRSVLAEIIEPRMCEIFALVRRELERSSYLETLAGGVVLCGGGVHLSGILPLAEKQLLLPVRLGSPSDFRGLTDLIKGPEFATVTGLARIAAKTRQAGLYSSDRSGIQRLTRKVAHWISEHF